MSFRIGMAKSAFVAHMLEREIRRGRSGHGDQLDSDGGTLEYVGSIFDPMRFDLRIDV